VRKCPKRIRLTCLRRVRRCRYNARVRGAKLPASRKTQELAKQSRNSATVHIIAGPNGAGKTTFASRFLPSHVSCQEFLNADLIAAGLSPFAPDTQNLRAGRLLLERIAELADERIDFGFETTLSGKTYLRLLGNLKASGYRLVIWYLWLPSAELAVNRVANRALQGGHSVPRDVIRRRYSAGLRNFFELYRPIVDRWWLYDGSRTPPTVIAFGSKKRQVVAQKLLYWNIERQMEADHEKPK
jgi:predicted ABC-type ATPase